MMDIHVYISCIIIYIVFITSTSSYTFLGCYTGFAGTKYAYTHSVIVNSCQAKCSAQKTSYFAIQRRASTWRKGDCQCADSFTNQVVNGLCSYRCSSKSCGGSGTRKSVYSVCNIGKWSTNCLSVCKCMNNVVCPIQTGICPNQCTSGWYGPQCNTRTPYAKIGCFDAGNVTHYIHNMTSLDSDDDQVLVCRERCSNENVPYFGLSDISEDKYCLCMTNIPFDMRADCIEESGFDTFARFSEINMPVITYSVCPTGTFDRDNTGLCQGSCDNCAGTDNWSGFCTPDKGSS